MLKGQLIFKSVKCTKKHTTSFRRSSLNTIKRSYTPGYSQQPPSRAQKSMLGAKLSQIIWKKDDMKPIARNIYIEHEEVAKMHKDEVMRWRKDKEIEATGFVPPNPVLNFNHMQFSDEVKNILKSKYKEPTPIQAQTWPVALSGLNLVGSAETGSGKTIAFMLPLIEHIKKQGAPVKSFIASPRVLVIAPTRELVSQIYEETRTYTDVSEIRISYAYGGSDNRRSQISSLRRNPQVVVGSPGRIIDFVESQQLDISHVSALVLDEADRMFDMGFEDQLRMILSQVRPDRQVLMFSATWPKKLQVLAREYFPDFVNVNIGPTDLSANKNVHQKFMFIEYGQKIDSLIDILKKDEDGKYLIFASMKTTVSQLAQELRGQGIHALELHGDKQQSARERTLLEFKRGTGKVLIATDVASRGLDIKNIGYVVNFDLPKNIEDYIHRIGRTARAGNKGESISFFTRNDIPLVKELVEVLESSNQVVPDEFKKIIQVQKQEQMSKMNNNNRRSAGGFSNLDRPRTQYGRRDNYGNNNYGNNNYRNNYGNNNYENNNYGNRNNNRRYEVNGGGNYNQRRNNQFGERNNQFGERNNESGFNRRRIVTEYDNDEFEERSQRNNSFGRRNNDFESEDFPQRGNGRIADMFENNTRNQEKRTENKSRLNSLLNKLGNNDQSKKKSRNDDLIVTDELEDD